MMSDEMIYEYQTFILSKNKKISQAFYDPSPSVCEKHAIEIVKYAVEKILGWSPKEMEYKFNQEIIDLLKLNSVIPYIRIPPEATKDDFFIYAHILYPNIVRVNKRKMTILLYNRVIKEKQEKFPKGFFDDECGRERAIYCLQYVIQQKEMLTSVEDVYRAFSGSDGNKLLNKYRLTIAMNSAWRSAMDYVRDCMPKSEMNDMWYHFYCLRFPTLK